jgi:ABC-type Fe3+/spermidine/putrescine transport system ATPase subunit
MSLEVRNLEVVRNGFVLKADFTLQDNTVLVLLGPSGCGKTTLLRAIAGLEPIQQGEILLKGKRIDTLPPEKRHIGFVFQDLALFEQMKVRDNIAYSLQIRRADKTFIQERIDYLAMRFRIDHLLERYPSELSGGERQRVALARALASDPSLILLDEPLSALDAPLRRAMRRFMRVQLTQGHLTAIHVTHDVEEAIDLADEIIVMRNGNMIARGTISALENSPGSGWLARFMNFGLTLPVDTFSRVKADNFVLAHCKAGGDILCSVHDTSRGAQIESDASYCVYVPFSSLSAKGSKKILSEASGCILRAIIVRRIETFSGTMKLLLSLPDENEQFFEMTLPKGKETLVPDEGSEIELKIDTAKCRLLPEEPRLPNS